MALSALPVFSTLLPPIFDYPNHLARMHLLVSGGSRFYAVKWAPLPNLAEDLVVPALGRLLPLALAAKVFLVAIFALNAGGAVLLNRAATGKWRLWPLLAFFLLYSRIFLWGFLNYLFGLGVALCSLALWLFLEKRRAWLRVAASVPLALTIYFCHLAAFGVYALSIFGIELVPARRELRAHDPRALCRRVLIAGAQLLLPVALFLAWQRGAAGALRFTPLLRKPDLLFTVFDNYDRPFDALSFALFLGLLAWLGARGRLGLSPRPGMAVAAIFAAFLALPSGFAGGSGLDHRLVLAFFLVLLAAGAPSFPNRRVALVIGAGAALLFGARLFAVEQLWLKANRVYGPALQAIDRLPRAKNLALAYPPGAVNFVPIPEFHLATLAIARRQDFVPSLFANPAQQPVVLTPKGAALAAMAPAGLLWSAFVERKPVPRDEIRAALHHYDFLVFLDRRAFRVPPSPCLAAFFKGRRFQIFAVRRDCGATAAGKAGARR